MLRLGLARMPLRLGMGGSRRFVQALSKTEPFHKSVEGPHWYLLAVGTRSEGRGRGLGSEIVGQTAFLGHTLTGMVRPPR